MLFRAKLPTYSVPPSNPFPVLLRCRSMTLVHVSGHAGMTRTLPGAPGAGGDETCHCRRRGCATGDPRASGPSTVRHPRASSPMPPTDSLRPGQPRPAPRTRRFCEPAERPREARRPAEPVPAVRRFSGRDPCRAAGAARGADGPHPPAYRPQEAQARTGLHPWMQIGPPPRGTGKPRDLHRPTPAECPRGRRNAGRVGRASGLAAAANSH